MFSLYEINLCFFILHSAESKDAVPGYINKRSFTSIELNLSGKLCERELSDTKFIHIFFQISLEEA